MSLLTRMGPRTTRGISINALNVLMLVAVVLEFIIRLLRRLQSYENLSSTTELS